MKTTIKMVSWTLFGVLILLTIGYSRRNKNSETMAALAAAELNAN